MKEAKIKLYKFEELSEESQKVVMDREREKIQEMANDAWDSEHRGTLEKFSEIFGIEVRNWEVSECNHNYWLCFPDDIYERDAKEVKGKYLLRFLNSIYFDIRSRRYYSGRFRYDENGKAHSASRYSKIIWKEMECPLTGVCYDCDILEPIYKWHKNPDWNKSLYDLVDDCLESFFKQWENEMEQTGSDEYVKQELIESSSYENVLYFANGNVFNGDFEEVA